MSKTIKVPKIIVPLGTLDKLSKEFGVCKATVRRALKYEGDSDTCVAIRNHAKKYYLGVEVNVNKVLR